MAAKLVFLGRLADAAGAAEMAVEAGALETMLAGMPKSLAVTLLDERIKLALNGELVSGRGAIVLADGDELAFLPPVSGG